MTTEKHVSYQGDGSRNRLAAVPVFRRSTPQRRAPWEHRPLPPRSSSRDVRSYPSPPSPDGGPLPDDSLTVLMPRITDDDYSADRSPDEPTPTDGPPSDGPPPRRHKSLLATTGAIAVATLVSRITGFFKQIVMVAILGGAVTSSFTAASLLPNMISELVLGAVLTAIVVPVLVRAELEDPDGGTSFVRRLFTVAFTMLFCVTVVATLSAPLLSRILIPEDAQVSSPLTTALSYLVLPAILFYGLSGLLTAILNTRQNFKPGAWAPVCNNLVVLGIFSLYFLVPGEITLDPVQMSDPHILILGLGITAGVITQVMALVPALHREQVDLRPLWGIDDRLKTFGGMAAAIVVYVMISQIGLAFATRISAHADDTGPTIYSQAWMLLQLPYGILGVTVLTAIMPRLSRKAAQGDTPAVVDDLSVATRLTLVSLVPIVVFLTFAGPWVGEALFGFGNFASDAARLGEAVSWSAFTLIPYALVLIHLRVFYAREQAWTPTWIILGITCVKIGLSALAPVVASSDQQVVLWLGVANGLGFVVGACIGGWLLHRSLGDLRMVNVGKTIWMVILSSAAGGAAMVALDRLAGLDALTEMFGPIGPLLRVAIGGVVMMGITFGILWYGRIPEVLMVTVAILKIIRRLRGRPASSLDPVTVTDAVPEAATRLLPPAGSATDPTLTPRTGPGPLPYPGPLNLYPQVPNARWSPMPRGGRQSGTPARRFAADIGEVTDDATGWTSAEVDQRRQQVVPPADGRAALDRTEQPQTDALARPAGFRGPKLIPGASVVGGRYRLLAPHGAAHGLKFWQAHDVNLDREVALTFVDADQRAGDSPKRPQAILSRTLRLGRISSPGLARVLDVIRGSSGGIVIAEWTPGRSLREMADTVPSPAGAANAIKALAAAAEAAHRRGDALSIDHPDRVRISSSGNAVLAFPATLADADQSSDVRGLGAMLYALITARWPLVPVDESGRARPVSGMKAAELDATGAVVEPRMMRPEVPFEISAVATRALEQNGEIRTAATVQRVLHQAAVVNEKTELIPPALRARSAGSGGHPDHALADPASEPNSP
ncbi:murein biosynthesis integral membrane protein MurJ [Rhodococcus sp. H29-C3]|uniref:murein biosynthesis integral membrane protein MurJ n=1 Tax=Rhodococcus sp. H29-C3 TaxID=3046307 RepID=UPI0024BA6BF8|nr:murein biosynthesis integral membrane protein MurJ [Rhodococcus sp. H29-C3]MDJ0363230.1 murein biosynthesis integral membrane protein MurJ [Rhodococcus sp. H29-C3]